MTDTYDVERGWAKGEPIPKGMPSADAGVDNATPSAEVTRGLADIGKRNLAETEKLYGELGHDIESGKQRVEQAYKDEGIQPGELTPWNNEREQQKYKHDPVEAFGSLGSVFGILASAFTGQPFYTALTASAAAINAVKQGKRQEFEDARKAWEENTKLALDRHRIQHEAYQDAATLLRTNLQAGQAKLRVLAAKYGDEKMLFLLDHGLDKDVIDTMAARDKLATEMSLNHDKVVMANAEMSRLFALGYDPKNSTSPESQRALMQFQKERAELKAAAHPSMFGGPSSIVAARAAQLMKPKSEGGEGLSYADAALKARREVFTSSKDIAKAKKEERLIGSVNDTLDSAIGLIDKELAGGTPVVGAGGWIERWKEFLGNWSGMYDKTEGYTFQQKIRLLQNTIPRILSGTTRVTAAERKHLDDIISGLATVTSPQEAKAALENLRGEIAKITGSTLQKGDVVDGYEFLGGDKADQHNWKKVEH